MNFERLHAFLEARGEPLFRRKQAAQAFFSGVESWEGVTVYPKGLRDACAEEVPWSSLQPLQVQQSSEGDTIKTLFACSDGKKIETVLMCHMGERNTVCISSQIGCAMGCTFCATGTMGLSRNLTSEELIDQVMHYVRYLSARGAALTNIVLMGMGEPFHNYDQVMNALYALNRPDGLSFGARRMSISTCGIVPGILRLADESLQVNLAISLHAATDDLRSKLMPVNRAYPLSKLMDAVRAYMKKTRRKVMFEYLLLRGINDRPEDANALAHLLGPDYRLVHVNVIKYHDTKSFQATDRSERVQFVDRLHALGVPATHRITFGEDIDAACGQLVVRASKEGSNSHS